MGKEVYIGRLLLLALLQNSCTSQTESNEHLMSNKYFGYLSFHEGTSNKDSGRLRRSLVELVESTTVQDLSLMSLTRSIPETNGDVSNHNTIAGNDAEDTAVESSDLVRSENTTEDNLVDDNNTTNDHTMVGRTSFEDTTEEMGNTVVEKESTVTLEQGMSMTVGTNSVDSIEENGARVAGKPGTNETIVDTVTTATLRNSTEETVNETWTTMIVGKVTQSNKFEQGLFTQRVVDDIWYVCHGIFGTIFEIFGIIGNIICIFVLAHDDLRSSTSILLRSLAVYDILVLTAYLFMVSLNQVFKHTIYFAGFKEFLHTPLFPILFGLASLSFMGSYYTTVAISIERCLVVSAPLKAAAWFSVARAKLVSGLIFVFVFVYSIPQFMMFTYKSSWDNEKQRYVLSFDPTDFSKSRFYVYIYSVVMNIACKVFIPLTILVISTFVMIRAVVKNRRIRKHLRSNSTSNHSRFTTTVMAVMTISLLSLFTGAAEVILYRIYDGKSSEVNPCALVCGALSAVSELIAIINSSVNFLLYCFFGSKFRKVVKKILPVGSRRTTSTRQ